MKKILSWFACLFLVLALTSGSKVTTVFVIGDSTAAEKGNAKNNPERGWYCKVVLMIKSSLITML